MNKGLHIAHVMLSLDVGGLERNVVNQVRFAPRLNQRASVICLEKPGALASQVESLGVEVHCLHKKPGIRPGIFDSLRTLLSQIKPDVVHTHQIGTLFYAGRAARRAGVPLVVHTEHGQERYATSLRKRWLGRIAARRADLFFCLTQDMVNAVQSHGIVPPEKVRLIQNGIDTAQYAVVVDTAPVRESLGIPSKAPVIGTVGRLTEIKRQDVLIDAFAIVSVSFPDAHLLLVGDGPLRGELEARCREHKLGDRVHFAGYQQNTAPFVQLMNVFALTSRSEGMPQAAIEASVAGVPVIASRVGGLVELIDHTKSGLLFESGDHEALARHMIALLTDPVRAGDLGAAGKCRAIGQFDISRMAVEYQKHFIQYIGGEADLALPGDVAAGHSPSNHYSAGSP